MKRGRCRWFTEEEIEWRTNEDSAKKSSKRRILSIFGALPHRFCAHLSHFALISNPFTSSTSLLHISIPGSKLEQLFVRPSPLPLCGAPLHSEQIRKNKAQHVDGMLPTAPRCAVTRGCLQCYGYPCYTISSDTHLNPPFPSFNDLRQAPRQCHVRETSSEPIVNLQSLRVDS